LRLNKYLAACGFGSRRACDRLIDEQAVHVNGQPVLSQGLQVDPDQDRVEVHGVLARLQAPVYLLLNKPKDVLCTSSDPEGRRTFLDLLPPEIDQRVFTVGRLDRASEGLLLITNDGDWAQHMLHPRHHVEKEYEVELDSRLSRAQLERIRGGVQSRGEELRVLRIEAEGERQYRIWLGEGKNRHIRRIFEGMLIRIKRLRRVAVGPLRLQGLRLGHWRELTAEEIESLRPESQ